MIETLPGRGWGFHSTDVRVFATSAGQTAAIQFIANFPVEKLESDVSSCDWWISSVQPNLAGKKCVGSARV